MSLNKGGTMFAATMTDLSAKLIDTDRRREDLDKLRDRAEVVRDLQLKELHEEFIALQMQ